jgi:hypothetical protein
MAPATAPWINARCERIMLGLHDSRSDLSIDRSAESVHLSLPLLIPVRGAPGGSSVHQSLGGGGEYANGFLRLAKENAINFSAWQYPNAMSILFVDTAVKILQGEPVARFIDFKD